MKAERELHAIAAHEYNITVNIGGDDFTAYFDIVCGNTPELWLVTDGVQAFYKGTEITDLLPDSVLKNAIYDKAETVEHLMAEAWAEKMIEQYEAYRDYDY